MEIDMLHSRSNPSTCYILRLPSYERGGLQAGSLEWYTQRSDGRLSCRAPVPLECTRPSFASFPRLRLFFCINTAFQPFLFIPVRMSSWLLGKLASLSWPCDITRDAPWEPDSTPTGAIAMPSLMSDTYGFSSFRAQSRRRDISVLRRDVCSQALGAGRYGQTCTPGSTYCCELLSVGIANLSLTLS